MSSIDGNTVISIRGQIESGDGERVEEITRAHVDGIAFRKIGKRGAPFSMTSLVDVGSAATAKSTYTTYKATEGSLVTLVDDAGNSWANVMVLSVRRGGVKRTYTPVGGISGGGWLLSCQWVFRMTDT